MLNRISRFGGGLTRWCSYIFWVFFSKMHTLLCRGSYVTTTNRHSLYNIRIQFQHIKSIQWSPHLIIECIQMFRHLLLYCSVVHLCTYLCYSTTEKLSCIHCIILVHWQSSGKLCTFSAGIKRGLQPFISRCHNSLASDHWLLIELALFRCSVSQLFF